MCSEEKLQRPLQARGVFSRLLTQMDRNVCSVGLCFVPKEKPAAEWKRNLNSEARRKEDLGSARWRWPCRQHQGGPDG